MKDVITATCNNCGKESEVTIKGLLPNSTVTLVTCGKCSDDPKAKVVTVSGEPTKFEDVISVDEINEFLVDLQYSDSLGTIDRHNKRIEAKAKLHSLLISKLPEKKEVDSAAAFHGNTQEVANEKYNSALDDVKAVLAEMFGVQR